MIHSPPRGFFAYPSQPSSISEMILEAIRKINSGNQAFLKSWEECRVGGKVIIQTICEEIERAHIFCADLTGMNANVMFELGYAIAKNRRIWLILDTSLIDATKQFEQLRILTTIGYKKYHNSSDIVAAFYQDEPYADLDQTIFNQAIKPSLFNTTRNPILYLKRRYDDEASDRLSERMKRTSIPVIIDDPRESMVQTLTWYGTHVHTAIGVICHLTNPRFEGAILHNARYALVAGMTMGMARPLLMLADGDFLAPVDYRGLLRPYLNAQEALRFSDEWLRILERAWREEQANRQVIVRKQVTLTLPRSLYRFMREFWGVFGVIFSQPLLRKTFRRHAVQGTVRPEVIVP